MVPRSITLAILSLCLLLGSANAQRDVPEPQGVKSIRTLQQMRSEGLTRQKWDVTCGAAALSTLLTYDFKDRTPETAIVVWILHRVDAGRVRARGGFSLLELKQFAQARGYNAEGYSGMSMEELATQKTSVITPIRSKGVDHFVVVKGIAGGRVFIADPAFGNLTMKATRFAELWRHGIAFIVHPPDDRMFAGKHIDPSSPMVPDETLISRGLATAAPSNGLY